MIGSCRKWTLRWGVTVLAVLGQAGVWNACHGQAEPADAATVARYFQAITQGDANAVTQYLRQGAPIDARNELGLTGLHLAAYQRQEGVVKAILAALPQPAATPPADRPLGFDEYLESLSFDRHLDRQKRNEVLDAQTPQAMTAVHLAIGAIREEEEVYARIVAALLAAGANPNASDGQGRTALHKAAELGYARVVKVLLDGGSDPSIRTSQGRTASELTRDPTVVSMFAQTPAGENQPRNLFGPPGPQPPQAGPGENRVRVVVIDANGQMREIEVEGGMPPNELNPAGMGTLPPPGVASNAPAVQSGGAKAYQLSPQQAAVHEKLGYPDYFNILLIDDDLGTRVVSTRLEKWVYMRGGVVFAFCDGQCAGIKECRPPKQLPRTVIQYTPIQFAAGMTQDDVRKQFGPNGYKRLALGETGFRVAELRDMELWSDGAVTLSFHRGRLVTVQAACRAAKP